MNASALLTTSKIDVIILQPNHVTRLDWIAPVALNLLLMLLTFWLLVSLIHYGIKTKKWRKTSVEKIDVLNAGIVYTFAIVCAAVCEMRYVSSLVFMNIGFNNGEGDICDAAADAGTVLSSLVMWSVFLFLWFRQKAFYTNKMLSFRVSKCVKWLSAVSILLISISGTGYVLFFILPNNYQSSPHGCIYRPNNNNKRLYYGVFVTALIVFSHAILLGLFVHPLLLTAKFSAKKKLSVNVIKLRTSHLMAVSELSSGNLSSTNTEVAKLPSRRSIRGTPPRDGIRLILQKTFLFALLSIILDVFVQVLVQFVKMPTQQRRVNSVLFDVASFISLLFLIFSFATYKQIFTTCFSKSNHS